MQLPTPLQMTQQLIATPSVSSHQSSIDQTNQGVVALLAEWAEQLGGQVEVLDLPTRAGKQNVVASFGPPTEGKPAALLLSGHTDTVPCVPERWTTDPWAPVVLDDHLHGLGSADMKGFLALALAAIEALGPKRLRRPLILLGTADEECGMDGARHLVERGQPLAHKALIGEPTGWVPVHAHKGILMGEVALTGKSGHSSQPTLGANAIDALHDVMDELMALRAIWRQKHCGHAFDVPHPTMNFGQISGGDAPNRICGHAALTFDVRLVPGQTEDAVQRELRCAVERALNNSAVRGTYRSIFDPIPPFSNEGGGMVQLASEISGAAPRAVLFGTEAPFFQALGMDTVVMGPGSIDVAHQPNERIALSEFGPTIRGLMTMIERLCVSKGPK